MIYSQRADRSVAKLAWIDYVKLICLVFVYWAHSSYYCEVSLGREWLFYSTFYVDAFFIISGYLFFRNDFIVPRRMTSNVIYRILIPTIVFSLIIFFPKLFIRSEPFSWSLFLKETIGGGSFWFTSALAVSQFLYILFFSLQIKSIKTLFLFAVSLWIFSQYMMEPIFYPWYLRTGLAAMLLMVMGGLYRRHEKSIDVFFTRWGVVIFVPLIAIYIWLLYYSTFVRVLGGMGTMNIAGIYCILLSSYVLIRLCKRIPDEGGFVGFVAQNSILFYFLSGALPNTISWFLLGNFEVFGYSLLLLTFSLSCILALIFVYVIVRFFPFLKDIRMMKS